MIELKLSPTNAQDYLTLKKLMEKIKQDLKRVNLERDIGEYEPFSMSKEDAANCAKYFHSDPRWLSNLSSICEILGINIKPSSVIYPWWNDVTMTQVTSRESLNLETEYSHSYFSQLSFKKPQKKKPLSIIGITSTADNLFVLGSKSGAYNGGLIFVPSGSLTFNNSPKIDLEGVIRAQYVEELNLSGNIGNPEYCGIVSDLNFGNNNLIIIKTKLLQTASEIEETWRGCEGNFEFKGMRYFSKEDLLVHEKDMLEPVKLCLKYLS